MHTTYIQGVRAMLPVLMGVIPIAFVTGVAAVNCGMTQEQAMLSSFIMYAAASQLVAYDMLGSNAQNVLIFIAATVLNLRFLLYRAGIAPHLQSVSLVQRLLGAYALTDQAFGVTMVQFRYDCDTIDKTIYFHEYLEQAYVGAIPGLQKQKRFNNDGGECGRIFCFYQKFFIQETNKIITNGKYI